MSYFSGPDDITRRTFTGRLGRLGIAAGALTLGGLVQPGALSALAQTGATKLRKLGKTGLMLSPLGFGAQHTREADLLRAALDHGVNLIETSWSYGFGRPGNSCECVGKAIGGKRDSLCLAVAYMAEAKPTSKIWVAHQFEQTLRDLGTDHIDIFLWHHPGGGSINNSQLTLKERRRWWLTASEWN